MFGVVVVRLSVFRRVGRPPENSSKKFAVKSKVVVNPLFKKQTSLGKTVFMFGVVVVRLSIFTKLANFVFPQTHRKLLLAKVAVES